MQDVPPIYTLKRHLHKLCYFTLLLYVVTILLHREFSLMVFAAAQKARSNFNLTTRRGRANTTLTLRDQNDIVLSRNVSFLNESERAEHFFLMTMAY